MTTAGLTQLKDVRSGSSYLSQLSRDVEFGVGGANTIDKIEVVWPSGTIDCFTDVETRQHIVVEEGSGYHPVPVFITSFLAIPLENGVELRWTVEADEVIQGYRIYRTDVDRSTPEVLTDDLLAAEEDNYVDATVRPGGRYDYVLAVVQSDGSELLSQVMRVTALTLPLALEQNFPNPFNPSTTINFSLPGVTPVDLRVYDALGRHIVTLVDESLAGGRHEAAWNGTNTAGEPVTSGVYFYRLRAGERLLTRRMLLLK